MAQIIFPDAMLSVIEYLRPRLESNTDPLFNSISVGTRIPYQRSESNPSLPFVLVRLDGSVLNYRVDEVATIRIAIWHKSEDKAIALAQRVRAILLDFVSGEKIRTISSLGGISSASDPESETPFSVFTVAVRLRPQTI